MNIFVLDENPAIAATYACDKHVVKMILESGQMLSTAHRVLDGDEYVELSKNNRRLKRWRLPDEREDMLYKASFVGHPCTQWVMVNQSNYLWLGTHAYELCMEYTRRYDRVHKATDLLDFLRYNIPHNLPSGALTPHAQAMPDIFKAPEAVTAYRNYYNGAKARIAKWKNSPQPYWFSGSFVHSEPEPA